MVVPDGELRAGVMAQRVPAPLAQALLGMSRSVRSGGPAATDLTLETLLGRRTQAMRDVLAATLKPS